MDCMASVHPEGSSAPVQVAAEHRMDIWINERLAMRVVCTPEHLDELVIGRLLTEGLIQSPEDILNIFICQLGQRARVYLRPETEALLFDRGSVDIATCCTDNRTMLESRGNLKPVEPIPWKHEWISQLAERMRGEEPLYGATHAAHSCYLAQNHQILCCREDIGRHNALDKVIGWACIQEADPRQCLLFTTGRLPSDMVYKAIRSGVPVLASKTYPSDLGIQLARKARLTLITVRPNGDLYIWNDGTKSCAFEMY